MIIDEKAVFVAALELPGAKQREAYLQEACCGQPELLRRLRELLSAHEESQGPLDHRPPIPLPHRGFVAGREREFERETMRLIGIWIAAAVLAVASAASVFGGDPANETAPARIQRLIKQLGHDRFAKREEASKELDAIGEPAIDALRKATASDGDAEIRCRAQRILDAFAARAQAAAAKKELASMQGVWEGNGKQKFIIKGDRWLWGDATTRSDEIPTTHRITIVEVGKTATFAELVVVDGKTEKICRAIFRLDGDTLHYCGTYDLFRPTEFRTTLNTFYVAWKRVPTGGPREN